MPASFAVGTERKEAAAIHGIVGIRGVATLIIDCPADGDWLSSAASHFNFSIGSGTSGHIDHDGRLFFAGESYGDGIGAEHALVRPREA